MVDHRNHAPVPYRHGMKRILICAVALLSVPVLAACGGSAGSSAVSLPGTPYTVTGIVVNGTDVQVQGPVIMEFGADAVAIDTPCNDMGGTIQYGDSTLTVGPLAATKMGCEASLMRQDEILAQAMGANPSWQASNAELSLTSGDIVITAELVTADVAP